MSVFRWAGGLLLLFALLSGTAIAFGRVLPPGEFVRYNRYIDNTSRVMLHDPRTSIAHHVYTNSEFNTQPVNVTDTLLAIRPDGERSIGLLNIATGQVRILPQTNTGLPIPWEATLWSPNGAYLLMTTEYNARIFSQAGESIMDMMYGADLVNRSYNWSPDSTRLVVHSRYATPRLLTFLDVTSGTSTEVTLPNDLAKYGAVAWSPDSTHVAVLLAYNPDTNDNRLAVISLDGTVTVLDTVPFTLAHYRWSPDSSQILFTAAGSLHTYDLQTGIPTRLLPGSSLPRYPLIWSPDGAWALIARLTDTTYALYRFDPTTADLHRLFSGANSLPTGFAWSPDGAWLAFEMTTGRSNHDLYMLSGDGYTLERMTIPPYQSVRDIAWDDDSQRIIFTALFNNNADGLFLMDITTRDVQRLSPPGGFFCCGEFVRLIDAGD